MYEHHINDMIKLLVSNGIVAGDQLDRAKLVLDKYWDDKIAVVWCTEDVIQYAANQGKEISEEKTTDILQTILRRHDCEIGITWETINSAL